MLGELTLEQVSWLAGAIAVRLLWQGVVVGLMTAFALALLRRRGPRTAYAVGCAALLTFALLLPLNVAYAPVPPAPRIATMYTVAPTSLESNSSNSAAGSPTTPSVSRETAAPDTPCRDLSQC